MQEQAPDVDLCFHLNFLCTLADRFNDLILACLLCDSIHLCGAWCGTLTPWSFRNL